MNIDWQNPIIKKICEDLNSQFHFELNQKLIKRLDKVKKKYAKELMENPEVDMRMYSFTLESLMN